MLLSQKIQKFYFEKAYKIYFWLFVVFFLLQIAFWSKAQNVKAQFDIVPQVPNKYVVPVLSLGDDQFLFRALSYRLQNSGDVFAGFVALKKYDYKRLYEWFTMLDTLDSESHFVPYLASYYYSMTQNTKDTIYVINYLDEHSVKDMNHNWWWMFQAAIIAKKDLQDLDRAAELAYKLSKVEDKNIPLWVKKFPAFFLAQKGEDCASFKIIQQILAENEKGIRKISAEEMNLMRHFIGDRLKKLKAEGFDPRKCRETL